MIPATLITACLILAPPTEPPAPEPLGDPAQPRRGLVVERGQIPERVHAPEGHEERR